jgi:hypothetical protein
VTPILELIGGFYPIYYAPTLAAYERHAFVPQLYALPGVQPLSGAVSVSRLMIRCANEHRLVSVSFLRKIADGHIDDNDPPYLRTWVADYDYLYLTGPHTPNPLPDLLTETTTAARFTLYKIRHDSADLAMPSDHAVNR